jgi:quinol monooxygenase YgiN
MTNKTATIIYVVTDIWPFPTKAKEARKILSVIVPEAKKDAACLKYELCENLNDRAQFTFIQAWSDEQALEQHLKSDIVNKATEEIRDLLEKPTEIRRYRNIG